MRRTMYISRLDQIYTRTPTLTIVFGVFFMIYIYNTYIILFCNIYGCFSFIHENKIPSGIYLEVHYRCTRTRTWVGSHLA